MATTTAARLEQLRGSGERAADHVRAALRNTGVMGRTMRFGGNWLVYAPADMAEIQARLLVALERLEEGRTP